MMVRFGLLFELPNHLRTASDSEKDFETFWKHSYAWKVLQEGEKAPLNSPPPTLHHISF